MAAAAIRTEPLSAPPIAAVVDVRACSSPRLRMVAERVADRPVGVIGTHADAVRALGCGLRVAGACAPPLGATMLAGSALRRSLGPLSRSVSVLAVGPRAREAAASVGLRHVLPGPELPAPRAALPRDAVRKEWGLAAGEQACLLVASPAASADARAALDIVGRTAILGADVVLVVHPGSAHVARARLLAGAAGGAWRLVEDERAEDPELLAAAVDAAIAVDVRGVDAPPPRSELVRAAACVVRGADPAPPPGDPLGVQLCVRAGIPTVVAEPIAAGVPGAVTDPGRRFEPRRPNVAARALYEILSAASR